MAAWPTTTCPVLTALQSAALAGTYRTLATGALDPLAAGAPVDAGGVVGEGVGGGVAAQELVVVI